MTSSTSLDALQKEWKTLFQTTLPEAACAKNPAQKKWSVHVDHCFARIILDNIVGGNKPWMDKVKSPAWKNLTEQQLKQCIEMGNDILTGKKDLVELDDRSLRIRGKPTKGTKDGDDQGRDQKSKPPVKKQSMEKELKDGNVSKYFTKQTLGKRARDDQSLTAHKSTKKAEHNNDDGDEVKHHNSTTPKKQAQISSSSPRSTSASPPAKKQPQSTTSLLHQIAQSSKTPFQQRILGMLLEVPKGQYTTYGLIAAHLSSSPRAVGNAIRNNPFAPDVPCHRVLATGGGIGGFYGSWGKGGKEGIYDDRKRKLLRDEGVKFDGKGRVVGTPWSGFE